MRTTKRPMTKDRNERHFPDIGRTTPSQLFWVIGVEAFHGFSTVSVWPCHLDAGTEPSAAPSKCED